MTVTPAQIVAGAPPSIATTSFADSVESARSGAVVGPVKPQKPRGVEVQTNGQGCSTLVVRYVVEAPMVEVKVRLQAVLVGGTVVMNPWAVMREGNVMRMTGMRMLCIVAVLLVRWNEMLRVWIEAKRLLAQAQEAARCLSPMQCAFFLKLTSHVAEVIIDIAKCKPNRESRYAKLYTVCLTSHLCLHAYAA